MRAMKTQPRGLYDKFPIQMIVLCRELMEESSIHANELTRVGFLVFNMMDTNKLMKVVFVATSLLLLTINSSLLM
jgi:hypothetical protein